MKSVMVETVKNFEISLNEKTPKDLKIGPTELLNVPESKVLLNFKPLPDLI